MEKEVSEYRGINAYIHKRRDTVVSLYAAVRILDSMHLRGKKMVTVQDEINIQESNINQKSNNSMSVMLFTGASFVKKNC